MSNTSIGINQPSGQKRKLISVIGDEDTCVGFLLSGVGEVNKNQSNIMVVDKNTPVFDIEECFRHFVKRDNIDIILINQYIADMIRPAVAAHTALIPAVLEIPSKDHPYDPNKDAILRRAKISYKPSNSREMDKNYKTRRLGASQKFHGVQQTF